MKIGVYNLEPKYINIALEKIRMYHIEKGDQVENYFALAHSNNKYDRIYCSSIFDFTDKEKKYVTEDMICGGSGFDIKIKLPKEIDNMKPKINIGFTSRGCNRKCPPCIVWKKEGKFKIVGSIYDFWDGFSEILYVLDNNLLSNKKHFILTCEDIIKEKLKVSFSQGLDIRLIDKEICQWLLKIKHHNKIKFAWDFMKDGKIVLKKLAYVLNFINKHKIMIYVLCGYDTTFKQDMYRLKTLSRYGVDAFIMLYHKKSKLLNEFARWNNRFYFRNRTFEDFLKSRKYLYLLKGLVEK